LIPPAAAWADASSAGSIFNNPIPLYFADKDFKRNAPMAKRIGDGSVFLFMANSSASRRYTKELSKNYEAEKPSTRMGDAGATKQSGVKGFGEIAEQ
jgi:hypothetical protein